MPLAAADTPSVTLLFSDIRPSISVQVGGSFCEPVDVTFTFDNTSTAGGGPVPVVDAVLTAKIPYLWVMPISEEDIQTTKGTLNISHDGESYTLVNTVGGMNANETASMTVSLRLASFIPELTLFVEVDSPTFDPVEANNTLSILYPFDFPAPGTVSVEPQTNFTLPVEGEFGLYTTKPRLFPSASFSFHYPTGCNVALHNGVWELFFPTMAGLIEIEEWQGDEAFVDTEGEMTRVRVPFEELEPGGNVGATIQFLGLPDDGLFEYLMRLSAEEIADDDGFLFGGTIETETPPQPDLIVTKRASLPDSTQIPMLDTLTYTVTVHNIGQAVAENVEMFDPLPSPQLSHHSSSSSKGLCIIDDGTVRCETESLAPGDSMVVTIKTVANFPGAAINQAEASTSTPELNVENNLSNTVIHFPVTAERRADLAVSTTIIFPDTLRPAGLMYLVANGVNLGTNEASNVTMDITFSRALEFKTFTRIPTDMDCGNLVGGASITTVRCTVPVLGVKRIMYAGIMLRVPDLPSGTQVTFETEIRAASPQDPDLSNNENILTGEVRERRFAFPEFPMPPISPVPPPPNIDVADVEVLKSVLFPPGPTFIPCLGILAPAYLVGQPIFYQFTVRNNGKDVARDVKFSDDLTATSFFMDYDFSSLTPALQPDCQLVPNLFGLTALDCDLGDLQPGAAVSFGIRADAASPWNPIPNAATAFSKTFDPNLLNNLSSNAVGIFDPICPANFGIDMSVELTDVTDDVAKPASDLDSLRAVRVEFTNHGNAPAYFNTYTDTLPPALRYVTLAMADTTDRSFVCTVDEIDDQGNTRHGIQCHWNQHDPGETKTLEIDAKIIGIGHLDWKAYVRSGTYDPVQTNNTDTLRLNNFLGTSITDNPASLPDETALLPNYPNPFNPVTQIPFRIARVADVQLSIYALDGRLVRTLVRQRLAIGEYTVPFDATGLSSGVYLYRLRVGGEATTRKMVILR